MSRPEFEGFPKIARFFRDVVITEKIDGTNAQIHVTDDSKEVYAGSRTRWIDPDNDNAGFARWVKEHEQELAVGLGPGTHWGEWWGKGIGRSYGLKEKRFSLFNAPRWTDDVRPVCCSVVPVLYTGPISSFEIERIVNDLKRTGSVAAPGFMRPEGVIVFHTAAQHMFKVTCENDDKPKSV